MLPKYDVMKQGCPKCQGRGFVLCDDTPFKLLFQDFDEEMVSRLTPGTPIVCNPKDTNNALIVKLRGDFWSILEDESVEYGIVRYGQQLQHECRLHAGNPVMKTKEVKCSRCDGSGLVVAVREY